MQLSGVDAEDVNLPTSQSVQIAAEAAEYFPGKHGVQEIAPGRSAYEPAAHAVQSA